MRLPTLETLLSYRNDKIIRKFQRDFPSSAERAESLFADLMRYLWLAQKQLCDQQQDPKNDELQFMLAIYDDMIDVDNMWHCFILSTREYEKFCQENFGRFLHHLPDAFDFVPLGQEEFAKDLEKFVAYTYDHLGDHTVRRWFGLTDN